VGTLLCNSWGYEQTNVDFYEVVSRSASGATVQLRQVASHKTTNNNHMTGSAVPVPGQFVGEAFKKCVGAYGVQMPHGWTAVTEPGKAHSFSSYA
jgi:hypothetical protein